MTKINGDKAKTTEELNLFVQGEGLEGIRSIKANPESSLQELVRKLSESVGGVFAEAAASGQLLVMVEDTDKELSMTASLSKIGIKSRQRLHIHRCRKVTVTVNFNGKSITEDFPPSTLVNKVKKWADRKFDINGVDATEHALQLCGTADRPDEDIQVGALTGAGTCSICFDLVPKVRVEGGLDR